jgi:hypothetical protein
MNEKIEQLKKEALEFAVEKIPAGITNNPIDKKFWKRMDVASDKFAELIVRECASKVDNILREKKDGGGTMGDEIREHFGVEE